MYPCPICSNPASVLKYKLTFTIYQCCSCRFQFCPDASFNESFNSSLDETSRDVALKRLRKDNFKKIITSIKMNLSGNYRGLEVGSGHGWFLEMCKDNYILCEGIEPETRFNESYKVRGLNVKNGFYPGIVPDNTKYDFIIFNDVIEHLPDLEGVMKANYALLNPEGLLIINLPVQEGLVYFFAKMAYHIGIKSLLNRMWQFNFHSPHLSYFKKENLVKFTSAHNFHLKEYYKLKTINVSEIFSRIKQDNKQGIITTLAITICVFFLYPFFNLFPDTGCFIFKKDSNNNYL
jgi:SAM-dependent methyltransferase